MTPPTTALNVIQKDMLVVLPPFDLSTLCCCRIFDPHLEPHEHLADCELQCVTTTSSTSGTVTDPQRIEKRKKHRESMARLRHGWRTSIATLQHQEEQLRSVLRRTIAAPTRETTLDTAPDSGLNRVSVLRRAYHGLVEEQLRLEVERDGLEAARAHREKYARLLQRELGRIRTFHASGTTT